MSGPGVLREAEGLAGLVDVLEAGGFTADGIRDSLGIEPNASPRTADLPVHLRRLPAGGTRPALIKLFVLGVAVDAGEAGAALAPLDLERVIASGLLRRAAGGVESPVRLVAVHGLVLACDRIEDGARRVAGDHVVGPAQASALLAGLTVRRPIGAALDVGTGPGVQAFLAARHARRVVATDVSTRALEFAAFNATLNGIRNVELAAGSLLEPVAGAAFDLIVSNPPFVISPDRTYAFRDSGRRGHDLCHELVRGLPGALNEGGYASVLVSWFHRQDEDWTRPLRSWVEGSGCDAWIVRFEVQDRLTHAAAWNRPPHLIEPSQYAGAIERWLAYTRELGAELISSGAIVLRRRAGRNWVRADELAAERIGVAGEHVARLFEAQDYLETREDGALLEARLRVVPHARIEQVLRPGERGLETESAAIRLTHGLGFRAQIDAASGRLLARLDGRRRLRQAIAETAAELGAAAGTADPAGLERAAVPLVRRMLETGFVEPV